MNKTVDARGLSCPQPVMAFLDAARGVEQGELTVLVDTDTSKENVMRAALSQGWQVNDVQPDGFGYRLVLQKG